VRPGVAGGDAALDAAAVGCNGLSIGRAPGAGGARRSQHSVGDLGADAQHEAFGVAVRAWTPRRDLDHLDAGVRHDRVEGSRELTGSIADEEPEPGGLVRRGLTELPVTLGTSPHPLSSAHR